jgi:hypothetical protein
LDYHEGISMDTALSPRRRAYPQHNRDVTQIAHLLLPVAVVDLVLDAGPQLAPVCGMALSALGGEDVAVLQGMLVGRGQDCLVEEDFLDADM